MDKGRKFLSDLKLYSDFLGWNDSKERYETWEEACTEVFNTHRVKYKNEISNSDELKEYINLAEKSYKDKKHLTAQRSLQFRGEDMFKHNFRMFNCLVMFADKPSFLGNAFYLMLCGCGVGVNMMLPFINRLPNIQKRNKGTKTFFIQDTIEGWGEAAHILITSYLSTNPIEGYEEFQGYKIKFDYSLIRPKGVKVSRKYKAPGPNGIKQSFEKIENLLNSYVENNPKPFTSIIAYDFFMHLANAVLSGGIRRAACSIILSPEDNDLVYAKTGNWREINKQRERSNNSVGLLRNKFSKEEFKHYLELNNGISDIGFVFLNNIFEILNPCFEIHFSPLHFDWNDQQIIQRVMNSDITLLDEPWFKTGIQCCNLTEINGSLMKDKKTFFETVEAATISGTLQAGYTNFKHIKDILYESIEISEKESLLGVSITGWTNQPWLFNAEILKEAAYIAKKTNEKISNLININPSARITTVKPSGNASVILGTASGIHPEHSERYFRVMQLNKETETAKWLENNMSFLLEEGVYSETKSDYAVFVPIENNKGTLYKNELQGIKHLDLIKLVQENWVKEGKTEERCIIPTLCHNVSNTVIIDDYEQIANYIFENQDSFTAVSFLSLFGDKDWNQSPNTSVLTFEEIYKIYGDGSMFASGLIVDGLHYFNGNLWEACECVLNRDKPIIGTREQVLLKKHWVESSKRFAKNYFKRDLQKMVYCLKDIHLLHKWEEINRKFKNVNFTEILTVPQYIDIDTMGAISCHGGSCEI
jgi:ribonucleoside-triphosphate reductase